MSITVVNRVVVILRPAVRERLHDALVRPLADHIRDQRFDAGIEQLQRVGTSRPSAAAQRRTRAARGAETAPDRVAPSHGQSDARSGAPVHRPPASCSDSEPHRTSIDCRPDPPGIIPASQTVPHACTGGRRAYALDVARGGDWLSGRSNDPHARPGGLQRTGQLPPQPAGPPFPWPRGMRAAVSLSFDDARGSQLDVGIPLFAKRATHVTFYLTANNIGRRAAEWRKAAAAGHELETTRRRTLQREFRMVARPRARGPHAGSHPGRDGRRQPADCAGDRRHAHLVCLPVRTEVRRPRVRGGQLRPGGARAVCRRPRMARRGPEDPAFVDRAQTLGYSMDDMEFSELKAAVDQRLRRDSGWCSPGTTSVRRPGRR